MKVTVIGCGRWGSFIGWYLDQIGHNVSFYEPASSPHMQAYLKTRTNGTIVLRESVGLTTNLVEGLEAETIIISVPSQVLRTLLKEILDSGVDVSKKTFILCMKGIEIESRKRLTEVFEEIMGENINVAVWVGPGHPQEFVKGIPN